MFRSRVTKQFNVPVIEKGKKYATPGPEPEC
jgi:hypothetical protein